MDDMILQSGANAKPLPEARILGQLLMLQNIMFVLPTSTSIAEFLVQALVSLPGVSACSVCLGDVSVQSGEFGGATCRECQARRTAGSHPDALEGGFHCGLAEHPGFSAIAIATQEQHFGFMVFCLTSANVFEAYRPFLINLTGQVALSIENRLQKESLITARDALEQRLLERGLAEAALAKAYADVEEQVRRRTSELDNANRELSKEIVERKLAEAALKESESRLRFALEGSNDGLWEVQVNTGMLYLSPRGCEILGYGPDELEKVAKVWSDLVHPDDLPETNARLQAHLEGKTSLFEIEQRLRTKSGDWKWVLTRGKMVTSEQDGSTLRMTGTHTDISERRHLEEQLRQSQKMEAVGQLAGGVAHDFNNILQVIMGYGNMLMMDPKLDNQQKEHIEHIVAAAEKAAQLTHGLLAFSRKQVMNPRSANLNDIVRHIQKFLIRVIGEDIQFKSTCCEAALNVNVDSGQIEQVLINLATNARDAMRKGGLLSLDTGLQEIDASSSRVMGYGEPGRYAVVTVSDTGVGMDEETRGRIFEPFFTTKEVGKGTGLGMAIVHGIIRQHNGFINVYSEPGKGTTFRFYIPLVESTPVADRESFVTQVPTGGNETILLAEDDAGVRALVEKILKSFGYEVLIAENGQEAVEQFARHKEEIKLIIMDMIMPKKSGAEAHREIRQLRADAKVLYSSGYTMDIIQNQGELDEGTELVMKPVQPLELLRKVREMLDRQ